MRLPALLLAVALACTALPCRAAPVERGRTGLADALRVALLPALAERAAPVPVALVFDATPYTLAHGEWIGMALHEVEPEAAAHWRVGRLGDDLLPGRATRAAELTVHLQGILERTNREPSTLTALRRSLHGLSDRGAVIVYFADWHFEDDEDLEQFIAVLKRRGQTLSVIGSEAAFTRGWLDGFTIFGQPDTEADIGRNPWRPDAPGVPWHGGETAWPHVPWRFGGAGWDTRFPDASRLMRMPGPWDTDGNDAQPERLRERIEEAREEEGGSPMPLYPLPSAFGPYGLMRAAQETGGRYVLWSWNSTGRASVEYDYTRCDLFAPDLRPRPAILADIRRRPLAAALVGAWKRCSHARVDLVDLTPPVGSDLGSPRTIEQAPREEGLTMCWMSRDQWRAFLRRCERTIEAADASLRLLDAALARPREGDDTVDRRYRADAELLRHILAVQRFSLGEALALAEGLDKEAWADPDRFPCLREVEYIPRTPVGEEPKARDLELDDPERGAELLADRAELLRRYRGTPFGEQIRRNAVQAYELDFRAALKNSPGSGKPAETPAFSDDDATPTRRERGPTTPRGGTSGGSGPSSGG